MPNSTNPPSRSGDTGEKLHTVEAVARILGTSEADVQMRVDRGELRAVHVPLIPASAVLAALDMDACGSDTPSNQ